MTELREGRPHVVPETYVPTIHGEQMDPDGYLHQDSGAADPDATVRDHLLAQQGIGEVKADEILGEIGVDGDRSLSSLGKRQREKLDAAVAEH